jgi:hypothetical protein
MLGLIPDHADRKATYSKEAFDRIAVAIGKRTADVVAHQEYFENAALAFRLDCGLPSSDLARIPKLRPYQMRLKMQQIGKRSRRLLESLGIGHQDGDLKIEDAYDGPGDLEILRILSWAANHDEDPVIVATRRVGRLAEILKAVEAARHLEQWADLGANEVIKFRGLTVPTEHQGDVAVNNWIAAMLSVYKRITGKEPGTSVSAPGS